MRRKDREVTDRNEIIEINEDVYRSLNNDYDYYKMTICNENDTYLFDGTSWLLQSGSERTVTFENIAGQPTDNTNLATALNSKLPNTTKYGSSISYANNKLQLKDQDGNVLGTEQTIVPGHTITYDSTKEEIVFA